MSLRLLAALLVAVTLLTGTLGCSKKDDPAPSPAAGTGSYQLDSRAIASTAQVTITPDVTGTALTVRLTTTPQPATGEEFLEIFYFKNTGDPNSAYHATHLMLVPHDKTGAPLTVVGFVPGTITLSETSTGGFSGTFSAQSIYTTPTQAITTGVFTDVHP